MELINKYLLDSEVDYLKNSYDLKKLILFKNSVFSGTLKKTKVFLFPFFSSNKNIITDYQIIQSSFKKKIGSELFSFWECDLNSSPGKMFFDILFISDNPISIIRHYSNYYSSYKNKSVICVVPFLLNKRTVQIIKEKYYSQKVITVFDDEKLKDIQRLKVSSIYSDIDLSIEKRGSNIIIKRILNGKNYTIKKNSIKNNLIVKNKIKHKSN